MIKNRLMRSLLRLALLDQEQVDEKLVVMLALLDQEQVDEKPVEC